MKELKEILLKLVKQSKENNLEQQKVLDEWFYQRQIAKTKEEKEKIDNIYIQMNEKLEKINDDAYLTYYNTIHSMFSNYLIDEINEQIGYDFMSEKFLNVIFK